jgi:glyoxalase family protein
MQLQGIHHISAITGDARRNLDFYTRVLGLRLVAKTVNQDDPSVYHLFYADEQGRPGSEMTFFEYPHAIPGRPGAGMVHRIVWRVGSPEALEFWAERLGLLEVAVTRGDGDGDVASVRFSDPEGLDHELVVNATGDAPLAAEHPEIPQAHALQGFDGVRAYAADPARSGALLEQILGAEKTGENTWTLRGDARGGWIAYDPAPAERGRQSGGSVHHVAWGTNVAEHPRWQERFEETGLPTSGIIDRTYFKSIYFREPSGVLFEIADDAPGFTIDSPVSELGRKIILPPQFEDRREQLEARLTPLPDPRAGWATRT